MKTKLLPLILAIGVLVSCEKADTLQPQPAAAVIIPLKNESINVVNVQTEQKSTTKVDVTFSTRYEIGIEKIEVYSGSTTKNLCMFYGTAVSGDSHSLKTYQVTDNKANSSVNYYMIKYVKTNGEWGYSPVYEIKMK